MCILRKKITLFWRVLCEKGIKSKIMLCTSLANHQKHSIIAQNNFLRDFFLCFKQNWLKASEHIFSKPSHLSPIDFIFFIYVPPCFIYCRKCINLLYNEK